MNFSTKVSVVIPHFNRAELLHETLASLQAQDFDHWEAVVVDDGSRDDQWELACHFNDERVRFLRRNDGIKGPSRCRNLGVKVSRGQYIVFVDSDDFVAPWSLGKRVAWMDDHSRGSFAVFPVMLFLNEPGDQNALWNSMDHGEDLDRFVASDPPWHTSSPIWRREAIIELGGFNENVMYGDDTDLHIRALLAGLSYQKVTTERPDVFIRRSDDARITNTISSQLLQSRLIRLREGSKTILTHDNWDQQQCWEGQYVVEAEFLMFNCPGSGEHQAIVLREWRERHKPSLLHRIIIKTYFGIANRCKQHCYIGLRIARRIAMRLLPVSYFPQASDFESACLTTERYEQVVSQLDQATCHTKSTTK